MTAKEPLSVTHPELAKQAHGWDPSTVTPGSNIKQKWICGQGHIWEAAPNNRSKGKGCAVCAGQKVLAGFNDLATVNPELAKQAHGWDPSTLTAGSSIKREWICAQSHIWEASISGRSNKKGCPICAGTSTLAGYNDLATINPELAKQAHGWDPKTVTAGSNRKVEWECDQGHHWFATVNARSAGSKCPICLGQKVLVGFNDLATADPVLAKQAHGWDPTTVTRSSGKMREWQCQLGHVWPATVGNRSYGFGCPVCSGQKVLVGFNDLATLNPELAKEADGWDPKNVGAGAKAKKQWKCKLGHVWIASVSARNIGHGCSVCTGQKVLPGFNDLASAEPLLAKQAHGWDPTSVTRSSGLKREWKCEKGHLWTAVVYSRISGNGCPICSGKEILAGFNDLATVDPVLAKQANGWDPTTVSKNTGTKRSWICDLGHVWATSVDKRSGGRGCPTCAVNGFDPNSPGYIYFLVHPDWDMYQIGITNSPDIRLGSHKRLGWEVVELRGPMDGLVAREWESAILRMLKAKGADLSNDKVAGKFDGFSEAWSKSTFEVSSIKDLMRLTEEFEEGNKK